MPTKSSYPSVDIPNVDLWKFLFERKDRQFPDDKGAFKRLILIVMGDVVVVMLTPFPTMQ